MMAPHYFVYYNYQYVYMINIQIIKSRQILIVF